MATVEEQMKQLPLREQLQLAEQLRTMYIESVCATTEKLDPAALRELDTSIAEAREALGMPAKGK